MSPQTVYLVTSGDLRLAANQICWPAQAGLAGGESGCGIFFG